MDTDLLRERILDTVYICNKTYSSKFLGFLSASERYEAEAVLKALDVSYSFFGGFDESERVMLGCFPEEANEDDFPITSITLTFREKYAVNHRDVLGTLMGLGLKREAIGDILIESGRAVIFLASEIADYVLAQITRVGKVGVVSKKGFTKPLPTVKAMTQLSKTIASERLDCVIAALIGCSRKTAAEKITGGLVTVNSSVTVRTAFTVRAADIIAVRSKGKFVIDSLEDKTKKDRIVLRYKKYI